MTKWRSVSAAVVLGSLAACATATNSNPGTGDGTSGTDNGTSGAPSGSAGAPAGGSAQGQAGSSNNGTSGAPGTAGAPSSSAGAATGGSSTGGSGTAGSGTAGASTGGAAGHAGAVGTAGAPAGGSAGAPAGTAGAPAGGAPTDGDGGVLMGACANPIDVTKGTSGGFGTTNAVCYRTKETFNTIGCSNFDGRTIKVNGVLATCTGMKGTFAAAIDGYNYFDVSAGTASFASFVWYSS